jgi:hypothetical protein
VLVVRKISFLVVGAMILSACSAMKDADQIKSTSEDIKTQSVHLAKRTNDLEAELSQKESYVTFLGQMALLFGEQPAAGVEWGDYVTDPLSPFSGEKSLNSESDLILYSGAAVNAMAFQLWKGDYDEDISDLDTRFMFAAQVLFLKCLKHIPRDFNVDVYSPDRSYKGLASLGTNLEQTNVRYGAVVKSKGLPQLSFYDLMIMALRDRNSAQPNKLLPKATDMILQFQREAIYILQLRHNYFPMVVMSRMTKFPDLWAPGRWLMMHGWSSEDSIDLDERQIGDHELKEWTDFLNSATETRKTLRSIGITPEYNSSFSAILSHIDFGQKALLALPREGQSERTKLKVEFARAYSAVIDEGQAALNAPPPVKPAAPEEKTPAQPIRVHNDLDWLN